MANTYTNILLHIVFAVAGRESLIPVQWLPHVHAYIAKAVNERGHHAIEVGGTENHVHILLSYSAKELIPDMVRDLKVSTSKYLNSHKLSAFKFGWQTGYSCFSVSARERLMIQNYIKRQHEHHKGISLKEEISRILERAGIEYSEKYLFNE